VPALISSADATAIRSALSVFFVHTCTITPITQGAEDTWGETADSTGTARTAVACKYIPEETLRVDETGRVLRDVPTLLVAHDDAIAEGDRVSNVQDAAGAVISAGPLTVETVIAPAGFGYALKKIAVLRGATVAE
jgi:hypothetical protein